LAHHVAGTPDECPGFHAAEAEVDGNPLQLGELGRGTPTLEVSEQMTGARFLD
jgi:hypothetical protein